jgi:hypothetical protein
MDPLEDLGYSPKLPFTGVKEQNADKKYDIIIPLDHVPAHLKDKIPDKKGGNTFKQARMLGAAGREREYTGTIANYVSASLKKQGYNVRIITPEEFGNYEDYDKFIEEHSNKGTTVLPFHLDADPKKGGIGFLARIRKDDELDRNLAQNLSPVLQKYASVFGQGQTFRVDTLSNSTINKAAKGPSALLELGSLVTLEGLFGKGFVSHPKYKEFLDELTVAITTSVTKNKSEARKAPETKKLTPMQERAKRNRERMFPTTMINPTVDEVNRRLGDLDVIRKETVDIIHKGERFTIRRNTRNDFTIYSKKFGVVDWRTFGASLRSNKPYSSPSTKPPAPKLPPAPKRPSKATSKRSSRVTPSRGTPKRPSKATPKRAWWDPRGWVGKKRGGLIGNGNQSIPSGYASYERPYGSFVVAIQPMIIQQTVPVDNPVVMPFPVATTVNSTLPQRG